MRRRWGGREALIVPPCEGQGVVLLCVCGHQGCRHAARHTAPAGLAPLSLCRSGRATPARTTTALPCATLCGSAARWGAHCCTDGGAQSQPGAWAALQPKPAWCATVVAAAPPDLRFTLHVRLLTALPSNSLHPPLPRRRWSASTPCSTRENWAASSQWTGKPALGPLPQRRLGSCAPCCAALILLCSAPPG